ncbi:CPBP family intramembrane metalloprotease [Dyella solisilvae]|uniref:CPBP family intramembrane metalloprotease n=1 Tax=Dyella solisilvae TaxID=1920168 RepID=A0A370KBI9_9GAMM|nr:type II CAAX endopeptidase family protein [Dyella solisilvae]RDJ00033.1 CPBP family intramembrane metalloprotease [Dyella solisilvae]
MDANQPQAARVSPSLAAPSVAAPGLGHAFGLIALYFLLQLAVGGVISLLVGLLAVLRHGGGIGDVVREGHAWLGHSDVSAIAVIATLLIAATWIVHLTRRWWPTLWELSTLPGFGFTRPRPLVMVMVGLALGALMPIVGGMLTEWLARGHEVSQDIKQLGANIPVLLRLPLALIVVSLGPLVEELLFRGVLLSAVSRHVGNAWAIVLTALLFAVVHLPDLSFLWYALPNLALLGLVLGWLRVQSGSIWPAVLAHGMNNLLAVVSWFVMTPGGGV